MSENRPNNAEQHEDVVVRKAERGWVVGDENVSDLTSAMVLADRSEEHTSELQSP